jgi:hypothetical protein
LDNNASTVANETVETKEAVDAKEARVEDCELCGFYQQAFFSIFFVNVTILVLAVIILTRN